MDRRKSSTVNTEFDELRLPLRILRFAAFLLPDDHEKDISDVLHFVFSFVAVCFALLQVLVCVHLASSSLTITSHITTTAAFFGTSLCTIVRHVYFLARRAKLAQLVTGIRCSPSSESPEQSVAESEMRMRSTRRIQRYTFLIIIHHVCATLASFFCIFVLPSFLMTADTPRSPRRVYSEMWWPFDIHQTPTHTMIIIWQGVAVLMNLTSSITVDTFTCALILATAERSAMLSRTAPRALLPSREGLTPRFRGWVQYHQHYLGINQLMGPVIFSTQLFGIVQIIGFSYLIMKVDLLSSFVALVYLITVTIQLYLFENACQQIIDNSEELGRNTLSTAQIAKGCLKEGDARSAFLVLVARCSGAKPEELSGMGYFTVSVPLFSAVLGASVSFLLVLVQFK